VHPPQATSRPLLPILSVAFVGSLGFSIVLPFLVFVVTRLGGNALVYGAVGATYSAFQLVGAPVLGRWSDRYGRRRVLLLSQIGTLLSWLIFLGALYLPVATLAEVDTNLTGPFTLTLPLLVLFVARALDGVTGGNVSVANAYLADVTKESDRSAGFGKMAVASNLGFVLGPAIAGLLGGSAMGEVPPVLAAIGVSVVATAIIFFRLQNPAPCALPPKIERGAVGGALGQEHKECHAIEGPAVSLGEVLRPTRIKGPPGGSLSRIPCVQLLLHRVPGACSNRPRVDPRRSRDLLQHHGTANGGRTGAGAQRRRKAILRSVVDHRWRPHSGH
jgi:DHA1 family tetracycline resistance protein-like MFS transporter